MKWTQEQIRNILPENKRLLLWHCDRLRKDIEEVEGMVRRYNEDVENLFGQDGHKERIEFNSVLHRGN